MYKVEDIDFRTYHDCLYKPEKAFNFVIQMIKDNVFPFYDDVESISRIFKSYDGVNM